VTIQIYTDENPTHIRLHLQNIHSQILIVHIMNTRC